jgi:hypothetical protein
MDESILKANEKEYPLHPSDPDILPESTYWPLVLAFGLLFLFWGLISSLIISGVGLVLVALAITGWILELNYEG